LIDELARRLPGGTVQTGATVQRVVDDGVGVRVHCDVGSGHERIVRGRYAVLAAPVWALRTVDIEPALNSSAQAAMMSMGSGSYVKVILRLHRGAERLWDRFDGRLFTLLSDAVPGCIYLRDGRTAGRDHVLTALVHGPFALGLHDLPEQIAASRVISGLQSLEPRGPESDAVAPLFSAISDWVAEVRVFDCP
jgi:monoamine oxidase